MLHAQSGKHLTHEHCGRSHEDSEEKEEYGSADRWPLNEGHDHYSARRGHDQPQAFDEHNLRVYNLRGTTTRTHALPTRASLILPLSCAHTTNIRTNTTLRRSCYETRTPFSLDMGRRTASSDVHASWDCDARSGHDYDHDQDRKTHNLRAPLLLRQQARARSGRMMEAKNEASLANSSGVSRPRRTGHSVPFQSPDTPGTRVFEYLSHHGGNSSAKSGVAILVPRTQRLEYRALKLSIPYDSDMRLPPSSAPLDAAPAVICTLHPPIFAITPEMDEAAACLLARALRASRLVARDSRPRPRPCLGILWAARAQEDERAHSPTPESGTPSRYRHHRALHLFLGVQAQDAGAIASPRPLRPERAAVMRPAPCVLRLHPGTRASTRAARAIPHPFLPPGITAHHHHDRDRDARDRYQWHRARHLRVPPLRRRTRVHLPTWAQGAIRLGTGTTTSRNGKHIFSAFTTARIRTCAAPPTLVHPGTTTGHDHDQECESQSPLRPCHATESSVPPSASSTSRCLSPPLLPPGTTMCDGHVSAGPNHTPSQRSALATKNTTSGECATRVLEFLCTYVHPPHRANLGLAHDYRIKKSWRIIIKSATFLPTVPAPSQAPEARSPPLDLHQTLHPPDLRRRTRYGPRGCLLRPLRARATRTSRLGSTAGLRRPKFLWALRAHVDERRAEHASLVPFRPAVCPAVTVLAGGGAVVFDGEESGGKDGIFPTLCRDAMSWRLGRRRGWAQEDVGEKWAAARDGNAGPQEGCKTTKMHARAAATECAAQPLDAAPASTDSFRARAMCWHCWGLGGRARILRPASGSTSHTARAARGAPCALRPAWCVLRGATCVLRLHPGCVCVPGTSACTDDVLGACTGIDDEA
ncbi:hypothetical protein C8R44DRAFT_877214 [Mycena epipterygia]|nr:hypothetical protein C8R44DRAFT_877214 [Mycena epipterygia]